MEGGYPVNSSDPIEHQLWKHFSAMVPAKTIAESNELKQFLEWPEFSFWKGFIQVEQNETG